MIFCRQGKKQHTLLNIKIKNTLVEQVQNFDFLGFTLKQNLSWGSHIDKVSYKISRCIGILRKLRFYLPEFTLKSIYNSLLLPHLTYGILAWGGNTLHLWKLQKKAVRIIKNKKCNSHTDPIFKSLNYLKVDDICGRTSGSGFSDVTVRVGAQKLKAIFFLTSFIHHKCQCTSVRTCVTERV